MRLDTMEEKIVWALAYAAAEASTGWDDPVTTNEQIAERADAAVMQFRKRCEPEPANVPIQRKK